MTRHIDISRAKLIDTIQEGQADLESVGGLQSAHEIVVDRQYDDASPLVVPQGAGGILIQYQNGQNENPIGFTTNGVNVSQVMIFATTLGRQRVTIDMSFNVVGSQGSRVWTATAEIGDDLDSLSPGAPFATIPAVGTSNNQTPEAQIHKTFPALSILSGLQVQVRLSHDGVSGNISITPVSISITTTGCGSGRASRAT